MQVDEVRSLKIASPPDARVPGADPELAPTSPAETPSQLSCPKCAHPMEAWESGGLALDRCFSCKGLWFDAGELGQHLAESHARIDEGDLRPAGETRFPCPRCEGLHLAQVRVHSVTLDVCPRCRGIFLDLGEVYELLGAIRRGEYAGEPALAGLDNLALGLSIGAGLGEAEVGAAMTHADHAHFLERSAARLLARFTEQAAVRRLARGLAGELLLVDHQGDIVDPGVDPRVFTREPADLAPERYAHTTLLMRGEAYLPGTLVVGAALRWHVQTRAALVCLVDDSVPEWARDSLAGVYDRVLLVPRLRAHESGFPSELLSDAYRDMYTKLHILDADLFPYERVVFVDADLLPIRCFDHLFTLAAPAAVIESVAPTSQYAWVHHMHGIRHGEPVPPAILEVTSNDDVTGGINGGLLVVQPDRARFEDMVARIQRPMPEWGPRHRQLYDRGIRYGFAEQHFLQVEFQEAWTAIDPRFNSMRTDLPHSFGVHWTIGRKPWLNQGNPGRTGSQVLWSMAWETLRLHHPEICADLEHRGLVRHRPDGRKSAR